MHKRESVRLKNSKMPQEGEQKERRKALSSKVTTCDFIDFFYASRLLSALSFPDYYELSDMKLFRHFLDRL